MSHNSIVITGIIVYVAILVVIVLISTRKGSKTTEAFAAANRSLTFPMLTTFIMSVAVASTAVLGSTDWGTTQGIAGGWFTWSGGLGYIAAAFFSAKWYRKKKIITVPEAFGLEWGKETRVVAMIPMFVQGIIGFLCQIPLVTTVVAPLLGLTPETCYIILPIFFLLLYVFAGVWGIAVTSIINFIVIWIGVFVGLFVSADFAGGFSALSTLPRSFFNPFNVSPMQLIAWASSLLFGIYAVGTMVAGAKDENVAKKATLCAGILTVIFGCIPVTIGMFAKVAFPDITNGVLSRLGMESSAGVHLVLIVGVAAAILSTLPHLLHMPSSIIVLDVIKGYFKPDLSSKSAVWLMRCVAVVMAIAGIFMAPVILRSGIMSTMMKSGQSSISAAIVLLVQIYGRPLSSKAAFWTILIPVVVAIFWIIVPIWGLEPMYPSLLATLIVLPITMKKFPGPPRQKKEVSEALPQR